MEVTVSFKMSDTTHPLMHCHIKDDTYSSMAQEIQLSTHSLFFKCIGRYSVQLFVLLTFKIFEFLKIDVTILLVFSLLSAADWANERK
jgi:hypothetical protein